MQPPFYWLYYDVFLCVDILFILIYAKQSGIHFNGLSTALSDKIIVKIIDKILTLYPFYLIFNISCL